jgi:hypothetical protein
MREPREHVTPWVRDALRHPASSSASQRSAIMDRVRREPAPRLMEAPMRASRWMRRGLLTPMGGMAMVAAMVAMITLRGIEQQRVVGGLVGSALILGDSVVPHEHGPVAGSARADSLGERLLDTLRIVEFVLRGPEVRTASVVGEFNAWQRGATTLTHGDDGSWRARVLVPRDALRFAYVVNDAQVVPTQSVREGPTSRAPSADSI